MEKSDYKKPEAEAILKDVEAFLKEAPYTVLEISQSERYGYTTKTLLLDWANKSSLSLTLMTKVNAT